MKKLFFIHGLAAAALAGFSSLFYNAMYCRLFYVDFSALINAGSVLSSSLIACVMIACGDLVFYRWKGMKLLGLYNLLVFGLSCFSIIGVLTFSLPLNISYPELFPGLAIPMHFFPAFSYFALTPFFKK